MTIPPSDNISPTRIERPAGVTIVGILQILISIALLFGVEVAAYFAPLGPLTIAFAILPLICAIGLFSGKPWARTLMLLGAMFDILSIIGLIWGVIVLWYFTRPRVIAYFRQPK